MGSFIPHYLVARVFRPIPARALLKRVFSDGKDTGCALLRGRLTIGYIGKRFEFITQGSFGGIEIKKKIVASNEKVKV